MQTDGKELQIIPDDIEQFFWHISVNWAVSMPIIPHVSAKCIQVFIKS